MKNNLYFVLFLLLNCLLTLSEIEAQVRGTVTDQSGDPLPFANVYIKETTNGTTTNIEGQYELKLDPGTYELMFQYVGYETKQQSITIQQKPIQLNVQLGKEAYSLPELEVRADAEDPAYPIIRKAIAKRKYYKNQVPEYSVEAYVKGVVKILDAPEKILGQEVGDMDGALDTTRQGIVYLSESESILHHREPDDYKEVMISSKVSGDDQGFSFNNASSMDLDFYSNTTYYGRNIVSPIANSAFQYYKYKLLGTLYDEEGRLINKIKVIPKRPDDAVIGGIIYIVEDTWNFKDLDVYVTGRSANAPFFDTLFIKQSYVRVAKPDVWRSLSRSFSLSGGFFGFKYGGNFVAVYKNYDLQPNFDSDFFDNEVLKVEDAANDKDSSYWNAIRPIPLTSEEEVDYVRKDSIQEVRSSKVFLDSMDKVNNKFKFFPLLLGSNYTYSNTYERQFFTIESPLQTLLFNTVQGWNSTVNIRYRKEYDKDNIRYWSAGTKLSYGFSEEAFRAKGYFTYKFNSQNFARFYLEGGREIIQFNQLNPISPIVNSLYSIIGRENFAKYFEQDFVEVKWRQEVANGVLMFSYLNVANRRLLLNNSNFSIFNKDRKSYTPNNLLINPKAFENGDIADNSAVTFGLNFRLRWNQKYLNYPGQKFLVGSDLPDLWVRYRRGIPINQNDTGFGSSSADYDYLELQIREGFQSAGLFGYLQYNFKAGYFLTNNNVPFQDYKHFNGNLTVLASPEGYLNSFYALPYYNFSTNEGFVEAHFQHHFEGFILGKIPLLRKLRFNSVVSANFLYTPDLKDYTELGFGLENIGFGKFRPFRIDGFVNFQEGVYRDIGFMIGVSLFN